MSITPLPARGLRPHGRPAPRRRPARPRPTSTDEVGLTFELTLAGQTRHSDAVLFIEAFHRLAEQFDATGVSVIRATPWAPGADDDVQVHLPTRSVRRHGRPIEFTRVEFDLLRYLAEQPRQVFTRRQLLLGAWGHEHTGERTVDVHIRRLRSKLGDVVTTVRGVGYRLADDVVVRVIASPHDPSLRPERRLA